MHKINLNEKGYELMSEANEKNFIEKRFIEEMNPLQIHEFYLMLIKTLLKR